MLATRNIIAFDNIKQKLQQYEVSNPRDKKFTLNRLPLNEVQKKMLTQNTTLVLKTTITININHYKIDNVISMLK